MTEAITNRVQDAADEAGASAVAFAFRDVEGDLEYGLRPDRWFHAASTIKVAVLAGLYDAIERGALPPDARVHVRNQFRSRADDRLFRVSPAREGSSAVHRYVGRTMRVRDLARHMIVTSSNLATNVLLELLGPDAVRGTLRRLDVEGIDFQRAVEDEAAWVAGINNRVTAAGLTGLLRLIARGEAISESASAEMMEILHAQEFVSGIPAGLPDQARVANKTGEISTVTHDAGIVFLPDRPPYVLAVLTEWEGAGPPEPRRQLIARISGFIAERAREAVDV